jgi:hypothetical protein
VINFVYGDSCVSGDDKYVIAQFRQDAPMEWVGELRAFLVKDELKYKHFQPERHRVQSNRPLWKRVVAGIERAEITIVDPFLYENSVLFDLEEKGAEYGYDFDLRDLHERTSDAMLERSPLGAAQFGQYGFLNNALARERRGDFSTEHIKRRIGGKRRDAIVTSARAHAMVTPSEKWELIRICSGFGMPSLLERMGVIEKMARVFDVEHPKSAEILNEFSDRIAEAVHLPYMSMRYGSRRVVNEERSDTIDHIQGADIAAGWAVDTLMLTNGDYPALAKQFVWVSVNGVVIAGRE